VKNLHSTHACQEWVGSNFQSGSFLCKCLIELEKKIYIRIPDCFHRALKLNFLDELNLCLSTTTRPDSTVQRDDRSSAPATPAMIIRKMTYIQPFSSFPSNINCANGSSLVEESISKELKIGKVFASCSRRERNRRMLQSGNEYQIEIFVSERRASSVSDALRTPGYLIGLETHLTEKLEAKVVVAMAPKGIFSSAFAGELKPCYSFQLESNCPASVCVWESELCRVPGLQAPAEGKKGSKTLDSSKQLSAAICMLLVLGFFLTYFLLRRIHRNTKGESVAED